MSEEALERYQQAANAEAALPEEVLSALCVLGSAQECAQDIERRYLDWSDEVVLVTPGRNASDIIGIANSLRAKQ